MAKRGSAGAGGRETASCVGCRASGDSGADRAGGRVRTVGMRGGGNSLYVLVAGQHERVCATCHVELCKFVDVFGEKLVTDTLILLSSSQR